MRAQQIMFRARAIVNLHHERAECEILSNGFPIEHEQQTQNENVIFHIEILLINCLYKL